MKRDTLPADPEQLVQYLNKYFAGAQLKTAYEAGFSGFVLHRYLLSQGIQNIVVHAASVEISARDRVKTDKRDSLKLATQLEVGRLRCIHIPSALRESYREVSRIRDKVARDKRRVGNRLKSLLMRQGLLGMNDDDVISKKWLDKVEKFECNESIKFTIQICIDEWRFLQNKLKEIDAQLAIQAQTDNALEEIYQSAPGVGKIHARVLANELEDMKQFHSEKALFSFTGLTPCEYSSGEHKRQGHISRQGRSLLRKTLIQAAWIAIQQDTSLQMIYEKTAVVAGKKRAIIGIARRLAGRIRTCIQANKKYKCQEVVIQKTKKNLPQAA